MAKHKSGELCCPAKALIFKTCLSCDFVSKSNLHISYCCSHIFSSNKHEQNEFNIESQCTKFNSKNSIIMVWPIMYSGVDPSRALSPHTSSLPPGDRKGGVRSSTCVRDLIHSAIERNLNKTTEERPVERQPERPSKLLFQLWKG